MSESLTLATLPDPTLVEEKSSLNLHFSRFTWGVIGSVTLIVGILAMALTFTLAPQYSVARTLLISSSASIDANSTIATGITAILGDKGFATELKARSGSDLPVS